MKKLTLFLICTLIVGVQIASAQVRSVSGTVLNSEDNSPIPGVSVSVKGTTVGTVTNIDGVYSFDIPTDAQTIVFSFVGMKTVEMPATGSVINVNLESDVLGLDEVIVTAYGTSTKQAFTGSADVVGAEELSSRNVTSPIAAIEGRATGVQFTSASGQPGSSPNLVIRGVGTLNGSSDPLYIVDGIQYEGSLNTINQEDIESFTILKDAASTSLYGSRAANGVVLITTKNGTKGAIKTSVSAQVGIVSRSIPSYDEVSPGQYYEMMWQALKNSSAGGGDPTYASANIYNNLGYNPFNVANDQIVGTDGMLNPNASVIYKSLDWYDEMEQTGLRTNYNVNVAGGGDRHKVFFSASYLDEEGYVVTTNFNRITSRLNAEFDAADWLKLGGSANIAITESAGPTSAGTTSIVNPFGFAKNIGSIYPVYVNDQNGNLVLDAGGEPVFDNGEGYSEYNIGSRPVNQGRHAFQELLLNDETKRNNTYGVRFFADFAIIEGLNLRLNYGRDINEGLEKEYENHIIGDAQPTGRYGEDRYRRDVENFNQILTFKKYFNEVHSVDITAGHESFQRIYSGIDGSAIKQVATGIYEFDNFAEPISLGGATTEKTIEGYFLRANYNFDGKYYISASVRRDASSVFDEKSRWGNFYSVGGSWRIDQENFMKSVSWVNHLKLRASYGQVGNDDLGDFFLSQPRYGLTSNAGNPAIYWSEIGNADLQWETVGSFDVALEFGLFNNLIDGSVEYYKKNSTDLLYDLPIPLSNGLNTVPSNIADLYNSGIEIGLTGHIIDKGDFKWDMTVQASTFKNEITKIPDPFIDGSKRWAEGRSIYDFYILQTADVDPDTGDQLFWMFEFDEDGNSVPVLDDNGNQETTNDWEETERAYTGDNSIPDVLGSVSNYFSYKGFDLNVLMTYGIGGKFLDYGYAAMMHSGTYGRSLHPDILDAWRNPGDVTSVPRMENGNVDLVQSQSSRFLTDASFWTLKNVSLGYTFDGSVTDKIGVDNLRLSLTGENLYLKSKRTGLDPQYNLSGTPEGDDFNPSRVFSIGLNVTF
ncbi:SusC/RagA family TonB-linked outer membrane protein [Draconibacterium sediminis]|uniref:Membrane protein n=1 Tax=Draconibacterium sediminis TaxID=1544798 RepID=A0A0D8J4M2_9BACT|nr:SusC/RagA family TonB-linked outer membrane protein [Draconibacterium sediminis]KJF41852.1 membrane protein [Draconibacterium sediminis]